MFHWFLLFRPQMCSNLSESTKTTSFLGSAFPASLTGSPPVCSLMAGRTVYVFGPLVFPPHSATTRNLSPGRCWNCSLSSMPSPSCLFDLCRPHPVASATLRLYLCHLQFLSCSEFSPLEEMTNYMLVTVIAMGFPAGSAGTESTRNAEAADVGPFPGSGRSPGGENGNPLPCSCQDNPMDRGAWWATVHGVAQNWTRVSDWACVNIAAIVLTPFLASALLFLELLLRNSRHLRWSTCRMLIFYASWSLLLLSDFLS